MRNGPITNGPTPGTHRWTAGAELIGWVSDGDPNSTHCAAPTVRKLGRAYLLCSTRTSFADLEDQLQRMIGLCTDVARAIRKVERVRWYGDARERFVSAAGRLPQTLDQIASVLTPVLSELKTYEELTFTWQRRLLAAEGEAANLMRAYAGAVSRSYRNEQEGMTAIGKAQQQVDDQWAAVWNTVIDSQTYLSEHLVPQLSHAIGGAPHVGALHALLDELRDTLVEIGKDAVDTPIALLDFLKDPSLENLGTLTKDIGSDAAALAALATAGAAAPGLAGLDG